MGYERLLPLVRAVQTALFRSALRWSLDFDMVTLESFVNIYY